MTNIGNLVQQASTSNDDSVEVTKLKGDKSGAYGRYRFDDRFIKNLASTQNLEVSRPKPDVVSNFRIHIFFRKDFTWRPEIQSQI